MSTSENSPDEPRRAPETDSQSLGEPMAAPNIDVPEGPGQEVPWVLPVGEEPPYAEPVAGTMALTPPSATRPPRPGFLEACLWCGGYLTVITGAGVGMLLAALAIHCAIGADSKDLLAKLQKGEIPQGAAARWEWAASYFASEILGVVVAWIAIRLVVGRNWRRQLAWRRPGACHFLLTLFVFPAMLYLSNFTYALARYVGMPSFNYNQEVTKTLQEWPWWLGVLVVGLGPAVSEEMFCRGFLGRGLIGRYGPLAGVLLTSFFFGALHLDPPHVLATFVMGISLHFTYLMTRSLWMPMLLHFLNNSTAVLSATLSQNGGSGDESVGDQWLLLSTLALAAALAWALYKSRVRFLDAEGRPWQADYPGAGYPPGTQGFRAIRPWPGTLPSLAVVLAMAFFGVSLSMNVQGESPQPNEQAIAKRLLLGPARAESPCLNR